MLSAFLLIGCGKNEPEQHKVGNLDVPNGVTMRAYSTSEPNYEKGNCLLTIAKLPQSKMNVIKYIWIEDFQKGLKPTVEKLSKEGLKGLRKTITTLSEFEGFPAHTNSVEVRFK